MAHDFTLKDKLKERQKDRQKDKKKDRKKDRQKDRQKERQKDRKKDRQKDWCGLVLNCFELFKSYKLDGMGWDQKSAFIKNSSFEINRDPWD